jgi:predicted transcriptional regulator
MLRTESTILTPRQLVSWIRQHGLTRQDAASSLGASDRALYAYMDGTRMISQTVALLCKALDKLDITQWPQDDSMTPRQLEAWIGWHEFGTRKEAAEALGISEGSLYKYLAGKSGKYLSGGKIKTAEMRIPRTLALLCRAVDALAEQDMPLFKKKKS